MIRALAATRLHWAVVLAALSTLVLLAAAPRAEAGPKRPLETGISGLWDLEQPFLSQAAVTGAGSLRVVVSWRAIAPASPPAGFDPSNPADPAYSWWETDKRMRAVVDAGFAPFALVTEAPSWAERCSAPGWDSAVCDPDPEAFAAFALAAAKRYSGGFGGLPKVSYWEPINEPNLSLFFNPQFDSAGKPVSAKLYRDLLNRFAASVKSVDPGNVVIGGGLGPIAVRRHTIGPLKFTRELLCMKGGKKPRPTKRGCPDGVHFDLFDIHPYTTGGPTHSGRVNDVQLGDLPDLRRLLNAAKRANRIRSHWSGVPIWVTEFSWDTKPPDPGGLPMKIAKRWVAEALYRAWRSGVTRFFWYGLRDEPANGNFRETLQSGLYFTGATPAADRPKPILWAFRFPLVAYPGKKGLHFWGRTPHGRGGKVRIQVKRQGRWRTVKRTGVNRTGVFAGRVKKLRYGRNERGAVRAVFGGIRSVPFSMRPVRDFYQRPFG